MGNPPPNAKDLKVAIHAFDGDAQLWDDNASTLDKARQGAAALALSALDFGPAQFGLPEEYSKVQQLVMDRCGQGATEFRTIATNLLTAKKTYLQQEEKLGYDISSIE